MLSLALVRAPHTYRYNDLDAREEALVTYLSGYIKCVGGAAVSVFDFHLDRSLAFASLLNPQFDFYVIAVRETGDNVHYALRIARELLSNGRRVVLYGQTARLDRHPAVPSEALVCRHDESMLAALVGLAVNGPTFQNGLAALPYFPNLGLPDWKLKRMKASLETTRGCHFPCRFCFINAGQNYPARWLVRPNSAILKDVETYQSLGINDIVFNDSEFIGASRDADPTKRALLTALAKLKDKIRFKIYARADTLLRFNDFDLLRSAGLVSVFMGVESLVQGDLDALNKKLKVAQILDCIEQLRSRQIYMDLSFILFNRATTVSTLRENLTHIKALYAKGDRHLGLPYFSFSFESNWRESPVRTLTKRTYVHLDVEMKSPIAHGTCFPTELEPLMELYRLLNYEWSKKITTLNRNRFDVGNAERQRIENWISGLCVFCADLMLNLLDRFECGKLTFADIPNESEYVFAQMRSYNQSLPTGLDRLETYSEHASAIDYAQGARLLEPDEYWNDVIPAASV